MIVGNVRRRAGRSVALMAGLALATTSFIVLVASAATSRTTAVATVDETAQAPYHIVVRPLGGRNALEEEHGLVRPNYLSGIFGGISIDQWRTIQGLSDVEVAAPVANLGAYSAVASAPLDVTDVVDKHRVSQIIRIRPQWRSDRGLTARTAASRFLYVTTLPLAWPAEITPELDAPARFTDGIVRPRTCPTGSLLAYELRPTGDVPICTVDPPGEVWAPAAAVDRSVEQVAARLLPNGTFELPQLTIDFERGEARIAPTRAERLTTQVQFFVSIPMAAVDPEQEARLIGLDHAVSVGRYFGANEPAVRNQDFGGDNRVLPTIFASSSFFDEQLVAVPERLDGDGDPSGLTLAALDAAPAMPGEPITTSIDDAYRRMIVSDPFRQPVQYALTAGPPEYAVRADGTVTPRDVATSGAAATYNASWLFGDVSFRNLDMRTVTGGHGSVRLSQVGTFDPARIDQVDPLARVPLETYQPPEVYGADPRSAELLGGRPLRPNSNIGGYLGTPPLAITSLAAALDAPAILPMPHAPISAIRLRIAGVTSADTAAMARVSGIAQRIRDLTGLDVDVTLGSSATPRVLELTSGAFGRPDLLLQEGWSRKGVASLVISAVESRSALLLGLILIVSGLFLANAAYSAVQARRREFAVLSCLGWSRSRLMLLVLGETALVGALAGATAAALAMPIGLLAGLEVPLPAALLAVPVSVGVAILAGVGPAMRAAGTHPGPGLVLATAPTRRIRHRSTIAGLALAQTVRAPWRGLAGIAALALGVSALTVLAAVNGIFHQALTGTATLLGDTVLTRVALVDRLAVVVIVLLGGLAVADVLFVNVRERAAEFASLQAVGWSAGDAARLVMWEGLVLGVAGSLLGALVGLGVVALQIGTVTSPVVQACLLAATVGVAVATLSVIAPVLTLRRASTGTLLAED
jgi:hypothetical protein